MEVINNIFGNSYEYTRKYKEFINKNLKSESKQLDGQIEWSFKEEK